MASGFGFTGGVSRCFTEWQTFLSCYTANSTDHPSECQLNAEDYFECLHHPKERTRVKEVKVKYLESLKKEAGGKEEKEGLVRVKADLVEGLGLIPEKK